VTGSDGTLGLGTTLLGVERAVDKGVAVLCRGRSHVGALIAKGDRDFATAVDIEVEETIRAALNDLAPDVPFLGEEHLGAALGTGPMWVLDPIDGTVNFARGSPLCGLSLALLIDGRPQLAVVDFPFLGERYVAAEGAGAYLNGHRIHCAPVEALDEAVVGLSDFSVGRDAPTENPLHLALVKRLASSALRVRFHGSEALDLAWTAAGHLGATIMLSNLPWDVSGGVLLVREAGGIVLDLDGTRHTPSARCTVACARGLQQSLVALIASVPEAAAFIAAR
jgi:myo-inositol-1(or 4)-monophosphatase